MFTNLECDAGFKNNIDEVWFIFQHGLKSLYSLLSRVLQPVDLSELR